MEIVRQFTLEEFGNMVETCKKQLVKIGYKGVLKKKYILVLNNRLKKVLGLCRYLHGWSEFSIELNEEFANRAENLMLIQNVVMHELIHTIKGCDKHTGKWLEIAKRVNEEYGYHISRETESGTNYDNYTKEIGVGCTRYLILCKSCENTYWYHNKVKLVRQMEEEEGTSSKYVCGYCGQIALKLIKT